jgi:thiol-disulfide isomerase/thioredoxin
MTYTRRALLAVAGTLAGASLVRKSWAEEELRSFADALVATRPPKAVPPIRILTAGGATRTLADYAGQGVVLNLWATWCVPCVAEMPALDKLAAALSGDRIAVLPLSSDRQGAKLVDAFFFTHGVRTLPVLLDPDGEAAQALGARGIPTTLIIDRAGREVGRTEGAIDWSAAAEGVRRLVGEAA